MYKDACYNDSMGAIDDNSNGYPYRDPPDPEYDSLRDEPWIPPPDSPAQKWLACMWARACLFLAPLLRRWFPQRWRHLALYHLHTLAIIGDAYLTSRYLENGAEPDGRYVFFGFDPGAMPLHSVAASSGSVRIAEMLLLAGADVNGCDYNGETALMWAAMAGHTDLVAFLLDSGARINDMDKLPGYTALIQAAIGGHLPVVKLLVARGADTEYRVRNRLNAAGWARLTGGRAREECADYLESLPDTV